MPMVVVGAAIAAAASTTVGVIAGTIATTAIVSSFAMSFAGSLLIGGLSTLLASKPKSASAGSAGVLNDSRKQTLRSSVAPHRIIYGRDTVGYHFSFGGQSGPNREYLWMVCSLAGHECDALEAVIAGGVEVPLDANGVATAATRFKDHIKVWFHGGAIGQPANDALIEAFPGKWTAAHQGNGICYAVLRLTRSRDVFPTGVPAFTFRVRGRKVTDVRTGIFGWSDNATLCRHDYLRADFGIQCEAGEINAPSFIAAANVDDETVTLAGGGTQQRYRCNGSFTLDERPIDIMEDLLSASAGALAEQQGQYRTWSAAAATPVGTLGPSDLRGDINVRPRPEMRDLFNAVRGVYVDAARFAQPTDFPPVKNDFYAAQDGAVIYRDIRLRFTNNPAASQRIGKLLLERARQAMVVDFPSKLTAFKYSVYDVIRLNDPFFGWVEKQFQIIGYNFSADWGLAPVLQEYAPDAFDWNSGMETVRDLAPNTDLPDVRDIRPPQALTATESLYETTGSAGLKVKVTLAWQRPDSYADSYRAEYRKLGDPLWVSLPSTTVLSIDIFDLEPAVYQFRVWTFSYLGVKSEAAAELEQEIEGLAAPPAAMQGASIVPFSGGAYLTWQRHPDLDVRIGGTIEVRHQAVPTGATWANALPIGPNGGELQGDRTEVLLPLIAGTYLLRAVDSGKRPGPVTAVPATGLADFVNMNVVVTSTQHPNFPGNKISTTVSGSILKLANLVDWDSIPDVDAVPNIDESGGVPVAGTYLFKHAGVDYIDLGGVFTFRVLANIAVTGVDAADNIDARSGTVDDWPLWDGGTVEDVRAELWIRWTSDNPAGAPTWSAWARSANGMGLTARAVQAELRLYTENTAHNIEVSVLEVILDVPDRSEAGTSTSSAVADVTVTFASPFYDLPFPTANIVGEASGDVIDWVSVTATGFTYSIRNAGARVAKTLRWNAKGYGQG